MSQQLQKAVITVLQPEHREIKCQFNPKELSMKKSMQWEEKKVKDNDVPAWSFGGGKAEDLQLNLFFDTTDTGKDVRTEYTDDLLSLMKIDTKSGLPPLCMFQWGKIRSFQAFVKDVSLRFTMFKPDGTPVRATADVVLKQWEDDKAFKRQNPTSVSEARKIWIVVEGETLDWIAYQEYDDPTAWRHIATANDLSNPKDLRPGQVLNLPPLSR